MSCAPKFVLATADTGLLKHWQRAFGKIAMVVVPQFAGLRELDMSTETVVWVDLSLPDVPPWNQVSWITALKEQQAKVIAASSSPKDAEAILALDAGCVAYCHAFSDAATLHQVNQVVAAGHIWIGTTLMQRLIQSAGQAARTMPEPHHNWSKELTQREREIAILAANGASNQRIARDCEISERTVKAHLSSVFDKLNLTDRLQLALRVHGIH